MNLRKNPDDRLLEGRELPAELTARFQAWKISRQEHDSFRDRLWASCPTSSELSQLSRAPNPWAVLDELEKRPIPPRDLQARPHRSSEPEKSVDSDDEEAPAPRRHDAAASSPATAPLTEASLPARPTQNPYAEQVAAMADADLFEFYANFREAYHLNGAFTRPEAVLQGTRLQMYQAIAAEVATRRSTA